MFDGCACRYAANDAAALPFSTVDRTTGSDGSAGAAKVDFLLRPQSKKATTTSTMIKN